MNDTNAVTSDYPQAGFDQTLSVPGISAKNFERLRTFIHARCGIHLADSKKTMLEGRIRRRYHKIGLTSFEDYCRYLFSPDGMENEIDHMIDAVTTNKTDFFREPDHFEYLKRKVLPELIGKQKGSATKIFRFWSAGCATGEEAYTLAMFLSEYRMTYPEFRFSILATDISTRALAKARLGIYEESIITPISLPLRKKYILKSKDPDNRVVRIVPELRELIEFRRLNFMDQDFGIREPIDIIFCRNVIIYFNKPTQEVLIRKFHHCLNSGGYLFLGHSESMNGLNVPFVYESATIYKKPEGP
jgi:chemotaxis protein methyltransferase CheR